MVTAMIILNEETLKLYADLQAADWFSDIGVPEADDVMTLSSWLEAEKSCLSTKSENTQLDASNKLTSELCIRDRQRYSTYWNPIIDVAKAKFEP